MINRRMFLCGLTLGALGAPLASEAQPAAKIARIGFLSPSSSSDPRNTLTLGALRQGLHELGYVEGQNFGIEPRWAEGKYERLLGLVAELVDLKVDVIVTWFPASLLTHTVARAPAVSREGGDTLAARSPATRFVAEV